MSSLVNNKSSVYKGYTVYYVVILPKKGERYNIPFVTSDNETGMSTSSSKLVKSIDGASFYELATGDRNAIFDLYEAIVAILEENDYDTTELLNIEQYLDRALNKK